MAREIDGFILSAGLGTRMGVLSRVLPKPAWPLGGRPLLHWGAEGMRAAGLRRIACNAHHLPARLREAAAWGPRPVEVLEEPRLLGSAGGLGPLRGRAAAPLAVWNGDALADVPWGAFREAHLSRGAQLSWLLVPHLGGPWNPVWLDRQGRVLPPGETGEGPYHFTGAALWGAEALNLLPEGPADTKADVLPRLRHHAGIVLPPFPWREVGCPEDLLDAARDLAPEAEGRLPGCYVHPSARPAGSLVRCILGPGAAPPHAIVDEGALWYAEHGAQVRLLWCSAPAAMIEGEAAPPGAPFRPDA